MARKGANIGVIGWLTGYGLSLEFRLCTTRLLQDESFSVTYGYFVNGLNSDEDSIALLIILVLSFQEIILL